MRIRPPRGGLYSGLVVEAGFIGMGIFFVTTRGGEVYGLGCFGVAALSAGLWALIWAARNDLVADQKGIRGKLRFSRIDLAWDEIESISSHKGMVRLLLRDGRLLAFAVPDWPVATAAQIFKDMKAGKPVRVAKSGDVDPDSFLPRKTAAPSRHVVGLSPLPKTKPRYAIPRGVSTYLALEKKDEQLLCVNVLLAGPEIENVAEAARVLAVRAADENRWDPTFSGRIRILIRSLDTPISEALTALMDAALVGARDDLHKKGWSVSGGTKFELSWKVMGPEDRSEAK